MQTLRRAGEMEFFTYSKEAAKMSESIESLLRRLLSQPAAERCIQEVGNDEVLVHALSMPHAVVADAGRSGEYWKLHPLKHWANDVKNMPK